MDVQCVSHWLSCGVDSRVNGRMYGDMTTKISRMDREPHFLSYGAPLAYVHGAPLISKQTLFT